MRQSPILRRSFTETTVSWITCFSADFTSTRPSGKSAILTQIAWITSLSSTPSDYSASLAVRLQTSYQSYDLDWGTHRFTYPHFLFYSWMVCIQV